MHFLRQIPTLKTLLIGISFLLTFPFPTQAEVEYYFERMWPTLPQPWYFSRPRDIAVNKNGFVYVADTYNHRIQKFTSEGEFMPKWGCLGFWEGEFKYPVSIAVDEDGFVYVVDNDNAASRSLPLRVSLWLSGEKLAMIRVT